MPCRNRWRNKYAREIEAVCDELVTWECENKSEFLHTLKKIAWLAKQIPVPVFSDWSRIGEQTVMREILRQPDVIVFDFPHSVVLAPGKWQSPSVIFTHNVEAEIFKRHEKFSRSPLHKIIWANQYKKMYRFEKQVLSRFDTVIAVSTRDCEFFQTEYQVESGHTIPTGVDTDYLQYQAPEYQSQIVFCGSMDWLPNVDAIEYYFSEIWPTIREMVPDAKMKVVGRAPPESLMRKILTAASEWQFTGFVEDVRPHIAGADVFVIPLRIGGGTRIKAFEAMAMGCPVVSTSIGMEGLTVEPGIHYLCADKPMEFAQKVASLLLERQRCKELSEAGRKLVQEHYGYKQAAVIFEKICMETMARKK
jgi:glycosyltransferase involved in cell wall biosynthesis